MAVKGTLASIEASSADRAGTAARVESIYERERTEVGWVTTRGTKGPGGATNTRVAKNLEPPS
jgi:hypothetical protein